LAKVIVTDNVSNQKALYYATSNNLCFCTGKHKICMFVLNAVLVPEFNQKHKNRMFSLKCYITAMPDFNQSLA